MRVKAFFEPGGRPDVGEVEGDVPQPTSLLAPAVQLSLVDQTAGLNQQGQLGGIIVGVVSPAAAEAAASSVVPPAHHGSGAAHHGSGEGSGILARGRGQLLSGNGRLQQQLLAQSRGEVNGPRQKLALLKGARPPLHTR